MTITLKGLNLGERHRYLNSLVNEAYKRGEPIETVLESSESSTVDRLFKIDLASKHRQLEYILKNLQDEDMLYVSRALKSTWLLEDPYSHIINPDHLEDGLYPYMTTTAVNKMKHWIHLNLRDSSRCQKFYKHYSEKDFNYAFKFLVKCSNEIILNEFPKMLTLEKITPHRLKMLCEKTPAVAKLFFDMMSTPTPSLKKYRRKAQDYLNIVKCVTKTDVDTFLDILENYFQLHSKRLSTNSTKFIMSHRKDRFLQKSEFYTARVLNVNAVAQCLTPNECEDLVIKFARARYLTDEHWFCYKNVEPFLKRLDFTNRVSFRKKVFVDKDIGDYVTEWPYAFPKNVFNSFEDHVDNDNGVFLEEKQHQYKFYIYDHFGEPRNCVPQMLCSARSGHHAGLLKRNIPLDSLFEEYRFSNYNKTLFELRKKLKSESSSQMRMNMYLVLVSKSGGRPENMITLFDLLTKHKNEPSQVRAAVIRSFVKRVSVWRVSDEIWINLLMYGHGLGLDGNISESTCTDGLHAVMIRALLSNRIYEPAVKVAFLNNFSTLNDYSLTKPEKEQIKERLLEMLIESANKEQSVKKCVQFLEYAVDTLVAYKTSKICTELIAAIKKVLTNDPAAVKCLLERLFRLKLGRKEFYKENFDFVQTNASYLNALKHDITILTVDKFIDRVVSDKLNAELFIRKMSVYFNSGNDDLAGNFLNAIKQVKLHKKLARPLTYLIGEGLKSYMLELDSKNEECKRFSALVRANAHVARPALNLNSMDWQCAGAKLIANRVIICKAVDIDEVIKKLLTWNRTVRLAVILAQRTSYEADIFAIVAKIRPVVVLKTALSYFRRQGNHFNLLIWDIVKPLIVKVKEGSLHLMQNIRNVDSIPAVILPEYLTETFKVISEINFNKSLGLLFRIKINVLKVDDNFIEDILKDFVLNRFTYDKSPKNDFDNEYDVVAKLYLEIFGKYLLLCKNEETQNRKFEGVGRLFFGRLQTFWEYKGSNKRFMKYLSVILRSMRNTEVFLNNEYITCLPVMQKVVDWMRTIIPIDEHFKVFVLLHLNMLYYKSIREAGVQIPGLLNDKQKRDEGYKLVGETFGRYISREAHVLTHNYFDSIVMLYRIGLNDFFHSLCIERLRLAPYIMKGIIDASDGIECSLALHFYDQIHCALQEPEKENILNCFRQKNLLEMQFFCESWSK